VDLVLADCPRTIALSRDLTRFNQKIFWAYGPYILLCIVSFAAVTWRLHDEFLAGEPAARCVAGFIATFWTIRVLVDLFVYDHHDWPQGNAILSGQALLSTDELVLLSGDGLLVLCFGSVTGGVR
jgi:hypothetical protein